MREDLDEQRRTEESLKAKLTQVNVQVTNEESEILIL